MYWLDIVEKISSDIHISRLFQWTPSSFSEFLPTIRRHDSISPLPILNHQIWRYFPISPRFPMASHGCFPGWISSWASSSRPTGASRPPLAALAASTLAVPNWHRGKRGRPGTNGGAVKTRCLGLKEVYTPYGGWIIMDYHSWIYFFFSISFWDGFVVGAGFWGFVGSSWQQMCPQQAYVIL